MIIHKSGNIFESKAQAIVNPVNTVGVMGKGLALEFKRRFPLNFKAYAEVCKGGQIKVGRIFPVPYLFKENPDLRWIINFPTKENWRDPSRLEWIEDGLADLWRFAVTRQIESIAIPALGAGLGGLDWLLVRSRIQDTFRDAPDIKVEIYAPK